MTEDKVKKAALDLIQMLELNKYQGVYTSLDMRHTAEFLALKASLTPSREEIADQLQHNLDNYPSVRDALNKEYMGYAIAELRKGESK